jgi:cell division protein FtsB
MPPDPTWLPSTIMQTIGALYAIFIAIFILVFEKLSQSKQKIEKDLTKQKEEQEKFKNDYNNQINLFKTVFTVLAYLVVFVELYNGMIVYFLSDLIFDSFNYLLIFSFAFFVLIIIYIVGFTYALVIFMISLETDKPVFFNLKPFNLIEKIDFFDMIGFIGIYFIVITVFYFGISREIITITQDPNYVAVSGSFLITYIIYKFIQVKSDSLYGNKKKEVETNLKKEENKSLEVKALKKEIKFLKQENEILKQKLVFKK